MLLYSSLYDEYDCFLGGCSKLTAMRKTDKPTNNRSEPLGAGCGCNSNTSGLLQVALDVNNNQDLLERAIRHVAAGVMVTDADAIIQYVNHGFLQMSGFSLREVVGQTPRILKSGRNPDDLYVQMWQTISSGKTWRGILCNRRKNGNLYWERQTISPVIDSAGVITNYVAVKEDVTQTHQQSQLHAGLVRSSEDAYLALDGAGLIIEWSQKAEALFGVRQAEARGRSFFELTMASDLVADLQHQVDSFLALGKATLFERPRRLNLHTADGSVFPAELSLAAVDLDNEWRFTGFVRDLTDIVQVEQQLIQAQKMEAIGQLSGGMAHDFNNILGIISGSLELLVAQLGDENKFLNMARDATQRASEVTKSLMLVSRRRPLNPAEIDANAAIREMAPLLQQTVGKAVLLELLIDGPALRVCVEPTGFNNAIVNLVVNARDAMPNGGRMVIYTYPIWVAEEYSSLGLDLAQGQYLVVGVDDTGMGMSAEIKAKAFEPFFTTKDVGKGTGLGLAMVYGFSRRSDGIARIESAPGQGCSVQMVLPVCADDQLRSAKSAVSYPGRSQRVLLVDNDAEVLRLGHQYLLSLGLAVYTATSPAKALLQIAMRPFDLLITDVSMTGQMDGLALAQRITRLVKAIKVIFLQKATQALCDKNALHGWLVVQKPIHFETLSEAVAKCLSPEEGKP